MMYNNKLVASLKANGKILREFKDTVYIPFGSEYSFLIKNLNTTRALVNIFIDGDDVIEGGLVLNAGQEVNLERYVKNGNLKAGNKFKFIERTANIEEHRGVKLEDGLVRIEFQYEKPRPVINVSNIYGNTGLDYPHGARNPWYSTNATTTGVSGSTGTDRFSVTASGATYSANVGGVMRGVDFSKGEATKAAAAAAIDTVVPQSMNVHDGAATMDWMDAEMSRSMNDVGITVPGSKSTQTFVTTTMGEMEADKHTIVLKLLGETPNNKPIKDPVTVFTKQKCDTCGKMNKAHSKFCVDCGTALQLYA